MASAAHYPAPASPAPRPRRVVLCLDGTWNSTYTRKKRDDDHYVIKPSNVLKLARAILPRSPADQRDQTVYYDIGVGSLATYPGTANTLLRLSDKFLGGGRGAGFEGNVEDALGFLALNYQPGDEVFIFGFSRGAATAQAVTRFIAWAGGLPTKNDAYYLAPLFRMYVDTRGQTPISDFLAKINHDRSREKRAQPPLHPFQPIPVTLLGVWDTVIAMGSRSLPGKPARRGFHVAEQLPACVQHACQALAIDELRYEFRPEIWEQCTSEQTLTQRWFAGVHSNIGGGYVDDGLANITFQWMRGHAEHHGLALDDTFADHYHPYPQDRQYRSDSLFYRLWDALPGRRGRGPRALVNRPDSANLTLDRSVIQRIQADPTQPHPAHPKRLRFPDLGRPYRPQNVLRYLADKPDLDSYLLSLDLDAQLPPDAIQTISRARETRAP